VQLFHCDYRIPDDCIAHGGARHLIGIGRDHDDLCSIRQVTAGRPGMIAKYRRTEDDHKVMARQLLS
jgi:hypothetical protein